MLLKTLMIAACAAMLAVNQAQAVEVTQPKTWGPAGQIGQWSVGGSQGFTQFQEKFPGCEILGANNTVEWAKTVRKFWTVIYFVRSAKCPAGNSD